MTEEKLTLSKRNIRRYLGTVAHLIALAGTGKVDLLVYGGSALILASNFRESTSDIDALIRVDNPAPPYDNPDLQMNALFLENIAEAIRPSAEHGGDRWLNSEIMHAFADSNVNLAAKEHHIFLETQSAEFPFLDIYVPNQSLMLAMKTKAMRIKIEEDGKPPKDLDDIINLLALHPEIKNDESLISFSAKFFPEIGKNPNVVAGAKELFTKHRDRPRHPAPHYAKGSRPDPQ